MKAIHKLLIGILAALGLLIGVTGCASNTLEMSSVTAVVDVRTATEFVSGHLQGALNIDVESSDFVNKVRSLDKSGKFLIYCHSGRRAELATQKMKSIGFSDVSNIGGIIEASKLTGLPIIQ